MFTCRYCGDENPPIVEKIGDSVFKLKCIACGSTIIISTSVITSGKKGKRKEPSLGMIEDISEKIFQFNLKEGSGLKCEGIEVEELEHGDVVSKGYAQVLCIDDGSYYEPLALRLRSKGLETLYELDFVVKVESISCPESSKLATSSTKIPIGIKKIFSEIAKKNRKTPSAVLREFVELTAELGSIPSKEQIYEAAKLKKSS